MSVAVLGPIAVDGVDAHLGPRDRVVLAALAVRPGETVSADRLADALWGDDPPGSWAKVVQGCISRLRKALGAAAIETSPHGYRLVLAVNEVDSAQFERLVNRGRELLTLGQPERAAYVLREALTLWRGDPLTELEEWAPGRIERRRLQELRQDAEELTVDAELRSGHASEILAKAQTLVQQAPLRERRWALLALAQYQCGRQADALRTIHEVKAVLASELGLDPGPDLAALERAVLRQDASLVARTVLPEPAQTCPYQGLRPYDVSDAETFFGRTNDVSACLHRLAATGAVVVVGPSGSGKSSLVRAGVSAALEREGRRVVVITPGAHPVEALTAAPEPGRAVLVVDQCEEALTLCEDIDERGRFFTRIAEYAGEGGLVVALRADRMGELAAHTAFVRLVEPSLHLLAAMDEDGLRAAIRGPADQAGLLLEPGLVDLLVREVAGEPGALPLLSHALRETWFKREGRTLTVDGYRATGGIRGAVARSADEVYDRIPAEQQALVRDLLLRLVAPTLDGEPVRSPVRRRLVASDEAHVHVIDTLVDARLVTSDDGVLELAHEALAREWPRLREWLAEDREGQQILRHLTAAADAWESMGRPDSELYRGVRLAQALDWRERRSPNLAPLEVAYLDASSAAVDAELRSERRRANREAAARRRTRRFAAGLAAALVAALIAAGLATTFQRNAANQADQARGASQEADANRLAALSKDVGTLDLSLLLAAAGFRIADTPSTRDGLFGALVEHRRAIRVVNFGGQPFGSALGDGGSLLFVSQFADVGVWDVNSQSPVRTVTKWWKAQDIAASPTGDAVAMWGLTEGEKELEVGVFDSAGREVLRLVGDDELGGPVQAVGFSPDGRHLLVSGAHDRNGQSAGGVTWMELPSGRKVRFVRTLRPTESWPWSRFGDDGDVAAWSLADFAEAVVVDSATGRRTRLEPVRRDEATSLGYLPLPTGAAQRWNDGGITLYDADGRAIQQIGVHTAEVQDVEVAADGRWAVTVGQDGAVRLWDVDADTGRWSSRGPLFGHSGPVTSAESTPDSSTLLTGSEDGTVISWDMLDEGGFGTSVGGGLGDRWITNRPAVIDPGELIVAPTRPAPESGSVFEIGGVVVAYFLNPSTGEVVDRVPVGPSLYGSATGSSVSVSPDRRLAAVTSTWATTVLDTSTHEPVSRIVLDSPRGSDDPETTASTAWSPDGAKLYIGAEGAAGGGDGAIVVVEPSTGAVVDRVELGFIPQAMELSPDSDELVAVQNEYADGEVEESIAAVLDSTTLERRRDFPLGNVGMAFDVSYSPDGSRLAIVGDQGVLGVFDAATGEPVHRPVRVHDAVAFQVEWLPDGRTVATTAADGRVVLYDADRGVVRAEPMPGAADGSAAYTFLLKTTDEEIVAMTGPGPARQYPLDPDRWLEYACAVAGRDLTRDEWNSYVPERPFESTCGDPAE